MKKNILLVLFLFSSFAFAEIQPSSSSINTQNEITKLSKQGIQWQQKPYINQANLGHYPVGTYNISLMLSANEDGEITDIRVIQSSGIKGLDDYIISVVKITKFKPYLEDGIARPFVASQPFVIHINKPERPWWKKILFIP